MSGVKHTRLTKITFAKRIGTSFMRPAGRGYSGRVYSQRDGFATGAQQILSSRPKQIIAKRCSAKWRDLVIPSHQCAIILKGDRHAQFKVSSHKIWGHRGG